MDSSTNTSGNCVNALPAPPPPLPLLECDPAHQVRAARAPRHARIDVGQGGAVRPIGLGVAFQVGGRLIGRKGPQEEDPQHGLVARAVVGLLLGQPASELGSTGCGDPVLPATSCSLLAGLHPTGPGHPLELRVDLRVLGAPHVGQRELELLGQLVPARRVVGEEPEEGVAKTHMTIMTGRA